MAQSPKPLTLEAVGALREGSHRGGRRQRYWLTPNSRTLILARYDGRSETIDELVRRLGVPRWRVRRWAYELGLCRPNSKQPDWTDGDLGYLEAMIGRMSIKAIAKKLGRTETAVMVKAKRLGVRKSGDGYTLRALCEGLGCDHHKVQRWIAAGWLRGSRRQSERVEAQGGDMWYFTALAIRQLVRDHPLEVDPRRVDWVWLVDILSGTAAERATECFQQRSQQATVAGDEEAS